MKALYLRTIVITALVAIAFVVLIDDYTHASDWDNYFRPAIHAVLRGDDPYSDVNGFYNPPWVFPLLVPFAILPKPFDRLALLGVSLAVYLITFKKFAGETSYTRILFPAVMQSMALGQLEWLAFLALLLPPWLAIPVVLIKPQVGAGLALYLFVTEWRERGVLRAFAIGVPFGLIAVTTYLIYGPWFMTSNELVGLNLFPFGLLVGIPLIYVALRDNRPECALASTPFLVVYARAYSFVGISLVPRTGRQQVIAMIAAIFLHLGIMAYSLFVSP